MGTSELHELQDVFVPVRSCVCACVCVCVCFCVSVCVGEGGWGCLQVGDNDKEYRLNKKMCYMGLN